MRVVNENGFLKKNWGEKKSRSFHSLPIMTLTVSKVDEIAFIKRKMWKIKSDWDNRYDF